ncbi:hypothetical protein [Streptomyces griseofuscus]|nr:hypothetical protein [Streptomyces griseofuscus]
MHPEIRDFYADREQVLRYEGAHLRAAWAAHPEDREPSSLILASTTSPKNSSGPPDPATQPCSARRRS